MIPDSRVRQRDFLLEISRAITAQLDLGEVLKRALHASVVMLAGQAGLVALRSSDGIFYVRAVSGIDPDLIPTMNQYLQQLVAGAEEGMDADKFNVKLAEMAQSVDEELRQSVALPLTFADEPLGLMIVFRSYVGRTSANDLQVLRSFADQAAIAVNNAQLYEKINQEYKRMTAILQHSADGVMILDPELKILHFNRALERMTGRSAEEAIGQKQNDIFNWHKLEGDDLRAALEAGWPLTLASATSEDNPLYVEGDLRRPDGSILSIGITYAPLYAGGGELASIIANVRDITNFRKAQEMQNTFISVVSHELKTPVAIIKGYAATLRRPDANWQPDTVQEKLEVIEDEADRLNALIQNLLMASKLQAQRGMSLDIAEVWLDALATRAVERFSSQTQKHQFTLNFPPNCPSIQGDESRLRQVIDNLLGNAIKYSPDGGIIEVGGTTDETGVTLYVRDNGVGLCPEDQERIFSRFYRVDGKLSRKTQGAGLGLYLSKAVIDAHDGHIGVKSQPGHGSTFYFTLPANQD